MLFVFGSRLRDGEFVKGRCAVKYASGDVNEEMESECTPTVTHSEYTRTFNIQRSTFGQQLSAD